MLTTLLRDGLGRGYKAEVNSQKELVVAMGYGVPLPVGTPSRYRYFNSLLGTTGADLGTTNENVNGGVTAVSFYIAASELFDYHIMNIAVVIEDSATAHGKWGNIAALTNGWSLKVTENGQDDYIILNAKTGGDLIIQSGLSRPQGDGTLAYEISDITGTADATAVGIPVGDYVPGGIRIGMGTQDKITSIVSDDLSGLDRFLVYCMGFKHYP